MRVAHVLAPMFFVSSLALAAQPKEKAVEAPLSENALAALKARSIGPAVMGGRVSTIALDPTDPATFYVGLGTGGIMKSTNAGASFSAIFEKEAVAAIGAIAVAPSDAKVVWVGTGEANDRNSSSWGNGVYRSEDSGATFKRVGLEASRTIARIVVHPKDPKTAWVAVMGDLYARYVLGIERPRIGLLSIGEEDTKGTDTTKEVFKVLSGTSLNFILTAARALPSPKIPVRRPR